jgi:hypothetical protein
MEQAQPVKLKFKRSIINPSLSYWAPHVHAATTKFIINPCTCTLITSQDDVATWALLPLQS